MISIYVLVAIRAGLASDPTDGAMFAKLSPETLARIDAAAATLRGQMSNPPPLPWWEAHTDAKRCGHRHHERAKAEACAARLGEGWTVRPGAGEGTTP
ncbi:MAG: hypothetical protein GX442_23620 [Candidatus Riflebacteria bacterium]|nr:hypothetical protein [Candidatus Riflebacteria bacterium]